MRFSMPAKRLLAGGPDDPEEPEDPEDPPSDMSNDSIESQLSFLLLRKHVAWCWSWW
jgi:hypothetical protein